MVERIQNFFMGAYTELRKVIWPSRAEVTSHTIIVILSVAISMAIIAALDFGLFSGIQWLINRG